MSQFAFRSGRVEFLRGKIGKVTSIYGKIINIYFRSIPIDLSCTAEWLRKNMMVDIALGLLILVVMVILLIDNYKPIHKAYRLSGYKLDSFLNDYGVFRRHMEPDIIYRERGMLFFENDECEDELDTED